MLLAVWLGAVRKCSAAVAGLALVLGLSMARRCCIGGLCFSSHFWTVHEILTEV